MKKDGVIFMFSKLLDGNFDLGQEMIEDGASEFYDLGVLCDGQIEKTDKGIVYELGNALTCIIRDYLRLYNRVNEMAPYPTVYKKALYPDREMLKEDGIEESSGTEEELNRGTDLVEETAKAFERLANGYEPQQEQVDEAFGALKNIFLGLWT